VTYVRLAHRHRWEDLVDVNELFISYRELMSSFIIGVGEELVRSTPTFVGGLTHISVDSRGSILHWRYDLCYHPWGVPFFFGVGAYEDEQIMLMSTKLSPMIIDEPNPSSVNLDYFLHGSIFSSNTPPRLKPCLISIQCQKFKIGWEAFMVIDFWRHLEGPITILSIIGTTP